MRKNRYKKLTIAQRQDRLNKILKLMEYLAPIVVASVATTFLNLVILC